MKAYVIIGAAGASRLSRIQDGNDHLNRNTHLTILIPAILLFCIIWCSSCITVEPEISGTPTPSSSPTPLPDPFQYSVTSAPLPTDALGVVIDDENHYYLYLSFGNIRVYEYETGTFLDGICINSYPLPLDGEIIIRYYDSEGRVCGEGSLYTADGGTVMNPGRNNIYAEIRSDISVAEKDFVMEVTRLFAPVNP